MYCKLKPNWCSLARCREAAVRNRKLFCLRWALVIGLALGPPAADAAELKPEAAQGFDQYVRLAELRMQGELPPAGVFLWIDRLPEPRRSEAYARLQQGEVITDSLQIQDPSGRSATPGALIHHWVGTIFIPGATLAQVLAVVQDYDRHADYYKPDVLQSKKSRKTATNSRSITAFGKRKLSRSSWTRITTCIGIFWMRRTPIAILSPCAWPRSKTPAGRTSTNCRRERTAVTCGVSIRTGAISIPAKVSTFNAKLFH